MSVKGTHPKKISSKSCRAISSAVGLLMLLAFVAYTSRDAVHRYGSWPHRDNEIFEGVGEGEETSTASRIATAQAVKTSGAAASLDDSKEVEQIFSEIKLEIGESGSHTSLRRASATRVATPAEIVTTEVVHGPHNYNPLGPNFDLVLSFHEILNASPVVVFVNSNEESQQLRALLQNHYEISPPPAMVDLEKHSKGAQLESFIENNKLERPADDESPKEDHKGAHDAPYLFINGHSVINTDFQSDIHNLHVHNTLLDKLRSVADGNVMIHRNNVPSNS
ncbi:LAME_0F12310g1_1 [Lachancea meyersii CBS 8951]|uniref:LAME_0F12310g1_1 n=1 Tax=Lachancea meyersii CBS 8951 TaxID=1266667 RepID=A0A1G4JWN0_9SACH|nr:LAME_0F12310g1_1 [Lachancea meyersii CBS 8951]